MMNPVREHHEEAHGDGEHQHGEMQMSPEHREQMRDQHHQQTLWVPLTVLALGAWLLSSPFTFGYAHGALMWSDTISGLVLMLLGARWCKSPRHPIIPWAACFVGIWLQAAPLIFWAKNPAAYVTDTFVGAWVIALTILIRGMPNMIMMMGMGPEVPRGWSYNPSSWAQRVPLIATAMIGWFISRYLAAYQLGYINAAWDPFFGESTRQVLTSNVSKSWPISDAGFGAFAYTVETMMGLMGGVKRWRTMPCMVTFFGILVVPLGLVHITLVVLQPVIVGHWCTLCLAAAGVMLIMIPLTVDEVVAMCQFLKQSRNEGKPFWKTFWKGGTVSGEGEDKRSPGLNEEVAKTFPAMFWGVSCPWSLLLCTAAGIWLMFSPSALGSSGAAADSNHLIGAVIVTVSVIATAEVLRVGRFLNLLLGAWIVASPFLLNGFAAQAKWANVTVGVIIILLTFPRGPVRENYGSWNDYIR